MSTRKRERLSQTLAQYYKKYLRAFNKNTEEKVIKKWDSVCTDSKRFANFEDWLCALNWVRQNSSAEIEVIETLINLSKEDWHIDRIDQRIEQRLEYLKQSPQTKFWIGAQEQIEVFENLLEKLDVKWKIYLQT